MDIALPGNLRSLDDFSRSAATERNAEEELGRTAFLELLIAQAQNQDPLEPAKNEDFIAQLAQFSSVEGIQRMNESMDTLVSSLRSSMTMDAAGLVGRQVLVQTDQTALNTNGGIGGTVQVDTAAANLFLNITNSSGQTVKTLELGSTPQGEIRFNWDGKTEAGEQVAQDYYSIQAYSEVDGNRVAHAVNLPDQIVSVSIHEGGLIANLAGGTSVPTAQIREIQ